MKFTATIGLNLRRIGAKELVLLTDVQGDVQGETVEFERTHCHAEINANIHRLLDRKVRHNRNRLVIQFEADIVNYYKPAELSYSQTLSKVRQIKVLGKA